MKFYRFIALLICILMIFSSCSGDVIDPIVTDPGVEYPTEEKTETPTHISLRDTRSSARIRLQRRSSPPLPI